MALFDTSSSAANQTKKKTLPGVRDPYAATGQAPPSYAGAPNPFDAARDPYAATGQTPPSYEGAPNPFDAARNPYKIAAPGGLFAKPGDGGGFFDMFGSAANGPPNEKKSRRQEMTKTPMTPPPPSVPSFGTESGPGILEQWFNQRATGSDPAFEYAAGRGMEDLANRYSAAGAFNSGAARRGESDFMANLVSQRMGQLDALAGGASGEHQGRLNSMFNQGMGIAGGTSGLMGAYDLNAANAMNMANQAIVQMGLNKAGVDDKSRQTGIGNLFGLGSLVFGG